MSQEMTPDDLPSVSAAKLLSNAYGLLGDGAGDEWDGNPEYKRAILELLSDVFGFREEDRGEVERLIRKAGAH